MKSLVLGLLAAVAICGAASADISGLVGNTVIGSTPDGLTRRIMLRADGSFRISVTDGSVSTGTWTVQGTRLCYARTDPKPPPGGQAVLCVEGLDGHKVGDRWMATGHQNMPMTMSIVAGQ